jgi:glycine hydroxymethyltransferase
MGLDLPSGGHLTHGFYTATRKVSATSIYWESMPYKVDPETGLVDMGKLRENALLFRPKLIICGGSAYAREWDYAGFRKIADESGAFLMCDMSHVSGLVASQLLKSPFDFCDIVTTTTHKSLRGPRSGLIFFKKDKKDAKVKNDFEEKINASVFPGCQGGPHNNVIAGVATQFGEALTPAFKEYSIQTIKNSQCLANTLTKMGYKMVTGGTDNHLNLWDLRPIKLNGSKVNHICNLVHITLNKNSVPGDVSALVPGGVRLGSPAMTSRGLVEKDFEAIASMLDRVVKIALKVDAAALEANKGTADEGKSLMKHFEKCANVAADDIAILKKDVHDFSVAFPFPGRM